MPNDHAPAEVSDADRSALAGVVLAASSVEPIAARFIANAVIKLGWRPAPAHGGTAGEALARLIMVAEWLDSAAQYQDRPGALAEHEANAQVLREVFAELVEWRRFRRVEATPPPPDEPSEELIERVAESLWRQFTPGPVSHAIWVGKPEHERRRWVAVVQSARVLLSGSGARDA